MGEVIKEQLGDGIELMIEGLPEANITPAIKAQTTMALMQHGIPAAASFSAGVIGGIRTASLKIAGEMYKLKFSIVTLRAITAMEIYNDTIQYIKFQKYSNRVDHKLADETIEYLRQDFQNKMNKWLKSS